MSDRDALLHAIFARPADDAPRLVYADWLDEHGEPAQAAFIRAQCALERVPPETPEHDHLSLEMFGLWDRLMDELRAEVTTDMMLQSSDFRRGFVAVPVQLTVSVLRDRSARWWPRLPIRAITVELAPWNVGEFVRIPYLERLGELIVHGEDPHGMVIPRLARCHHLRGLRVLDLSQFPMGVEATEALAASEVFRGLDELRMPYTMRPNKEAGRLLRRRFGEVCRF
jgi:uncharacterized protein (TIGR02996 family)